MKITQGKNVIAIDDQNIAILFFCGPATAAAHTLATVLANCRGFRPVF